MQKKSDKAWLIADLLAGRVAVGSRVVVNGWVRTRRDSKAGLSFIALNDGSGFESLQLVAANQLANYTAEILQLTPGCSVTAVGELVASPGQGQGVELQVAELQVLGWVDDPDTYPITPKYHTPEYLREHAHLRPRTNLIGAVMRIRHTLSMAIHRFFHERNFFWIQTPIITTSDCEGAGELFRVTSLDLRKLPIKADGEVDLGQDFFGKEAFLTVSGQLNVEAYCEALSRVYTFGPAFRAENSNTSRHLAEFWMVEPEIAFADLMQDAQLAEDLLYFLAQAVLAEREDDLRFLQARVDATCIERLERLVTSKVTYMEYTDAVDQLSRATRSFTFPVKWGLDLQSEHERYLTEELVNGPVVVVNYPKEIKSFYMRLNDDGKSVAAMDLLVPGIGEIIGGSQREERYDVLVARMSEQGLDQELYRWYLDLRRYGTVPHAGFGLGLERMVMYVTGIQNIRDVIPFPRAPKQADY